MSSGPPDLVSSIILLVAGSALTLGGTLFADWLSARRDNRREVARVTREDAERQRASQEARRAEARIHAENVSAALIRLIDSSTSHLEPPFDTSITGLSIDDLKTLVVEARLIPNETVRSAVMRAAKALTYSLGLSPWPHLRTKQRNLIDDLQSVIDAYLRGEEPPAKALEWIKMLHDQFDEADRDRVNKAVWDMLRSSSNEPDSLGSGTGKSTNPEG